MGQRRKFVKRGVSFAVGKELAEFSRAVLEALRQRREEGVVTVARVSASR